MSPSLALKSIATMGALLICSVSLAASQLIGQQLPTDWQQATQVQSIQHQPTIAQQFTPVRQPISADLQNQVSALSAQLAAAQRKIQYFQQQLSLANHQQQQPDQPQQLSPPATPPAVSSQHQVPASSLQHLLQTQQAFYAQPQIGSQQQPQLIHQQQQLQQQPQPTQQPQVSTLIDPADLSSENQRFFYRPQQPQQPTQHHQAPTSTTVGPPSIEPSLAAQVEAQEEPQRQAPAAQAQPEQEQSAQPAPPINHANPPHNPPRNDDKFSIGLGVLSPGYTQKFGNTALDFNQDKDGFSFTLSNNGHNNQPQSPKPASSGNSNGQ